MGCQASKTTGSTQPSKRPSAKATLLQEPVVNGKAAKLEADTPEAQVVLSGDVDSNEAGQNQESSMQPPGVADVDLQRQVHETLEKGMHDGSLASAAMTVEVVPVAEECIVQEIAPVPKLPWSCLCTACA